MHARTLAWQADVNGNGSLDADEVRRTLKKPQFVGTAMDNLDIDGDGQVTLEEWLTAHWNTYSKSEAGCRASLKAIEQALERNSDAPPAPSPARLAAAPAPPPVPPLSEAAERAKAVFAAVDTDASGYVDKEELRAHVVGHLVSSVKPPFSHRLLAS